MSNLLSDLPSLASEEVIEILMKAESVRIERIVTRGHVSPPGFWYDQHEHEWVLLVQGSARLRFESKIIELKVGDWLNIAAHERHRVEWTSPEEPTIWLAVFYR